MEASVTIARCAPSRRGETLTLWMPHDQQLLWEKGYRQCSWHGTLRHHITGLRNEEAITPRHTRLQPQEEPKDRRDSGSGNKEAREEPARIQPPRGEAAGYVVQVGTPRPVITPGRMGLPPTRLAGYSTSARSSSVRSS